MPAVKKFTVNVLTYDQNLVDLATRKHTDGESITAIAKALALRPGPTKMAILIGTVPRVEVADPAAMARAIVKARKEGKAWAWCCARFGVTEGTVRAAYSAATGRPHSELDYRRRNGTQAKAKKAAPKRVKAGA
jgi:hypothetical protein